ncbi:MAG: hypothetical protein ACOCVC_07020 [Spirochaeta sp.]
MILVILIPVALIAMMLGSLASFENNSESHRFWRLVHSALCTAVAVFSLTTADPHYAFSIGIAVAMGLVLLSDIAVRPGSKGSLYRAGISAVFLTSILVQPDVYANLPAVAAGGLFGAALLVSALGRRSPAAPVAQFIGVAVFTLSAAGLIALIPQVSGASVPLLAAAAVLLVVHAIERVYFPEGFYNRMRTGELTAMGAHLIIAVTAGMIGIEGGWIAG